MNFRDIFDVAYTARLEEEAGRSRGRQGEVELTTLAEFYKKFPEGPQIR